MGIFAICPMSHLFIGVQEQSYIAHVVDHATKTWKKDNSRLKKVAKQSPKKKLRKKNRIMKGQGTKKAKNNTMKVRGSTKKAKFEVSTMKLQLDQHVTSFFV